MIQSLIVVFHDRTARCWSRFERGHTRTGWIVTPHPCRSQSKRCVRAVATAQPICTHTFSRRAHTERSLLIFLFAVFALCDCVALHVAEVTRSWCCAAAGVGGLRVPRPVPSALLSIHPKIHPPAACAGAFSQRSSMGLNVQTRRVRPSLLETGQRLEDGEHVATTRGVRRIPPLRCCALTLTSPSARNVSACVLGL